MQVQHAGGTGTLVQVVHVLGNHIHVIGRFQARNGLVGRVGFGVFQLCAALVVKIQHQGAVAVPALDGGHIVHVVLLPQATGVPEGGESAFGRYSGPGKDYNVFFHLIRVL